MTFVGRSETVAKKLKKKSKKSGNRAKIQTAKTAQANSTSEPDMRGFTHVGKSGVQVGLGPMPSSVFWITGLLALYAGLHLILILLEREAVAEIIFPVLLLMGIIRGSALARQFLVFYVVGKLVLLFVAIYPIGMHFLLYGSFSQTVSILLNFGISNFWFITLTISWVLALLAIMYLIK
jgi:hypothetical protein